MNADGGTHAIVIGASMAGLVTARVLSDHVDRVTVLERDALPQADAARRSVPQGRHAHLLLAAGQRLLDGWFPGLTEELARAGAVRIDSQGLVWHQAGAMLVPSQMGFMAMSMSRPLLEGTVRRLLLAQHDNVSIQDEVAVDGLLVEGERVVGVRVDGAEHRADLVVACTGRNTRFLDQLAEEGFPAPDVSAVRIDVSYGTRVLRRGAHDLDGTLALVVGDPTGRHQVGAAVPIEDDRWILTVSAYHGEAPSTEPAEYAGFLRAMPSPVLSDLHTAAEALTPVMTHRMPTSRRRHVERLRRPPAGFVVLGDAICSFNPIYGQGMSSAALQAQALGRAVERHGVTSPRLVRAFYRRAARVVTAPWKIAAGADFADPRTTGPKPPGTDLVNRYLELVFRASHTSATVSLQLTRVQNLVARPETLMTPAMVLRVLRAARRSPAPGRHARAGAVHPPITAHSARNTSTWERNSDQAGSDAVSR